MKAKCADSRIQTKMVRLRHANVYVCLPTNYHNNGLKISVLVDVSYRDFALRNTEKKDVTYSNLVTGIAGMICE